MFSVHLVDDHDTGLGILLAERHSLLGTDCNSGNRTDYYQSRVSKCKCLGYLTVEVKAARRIYNIDLRVVPLDGCYRSAYRYGSLCLFRIIVGNGVAVLHTPHALNLSCIEQHSLCECCLSFAAMAEYAYVANALCCISFHICMSSPYRVN